MILAVFIPVHAMIQLWHSAKPVVLSPSQATAKLAVLLHLPAEVKSAVLLLQLQFLPVEDFPAAVAAILAK